MPAAAAAIQASTRAPELEGKMQALSQGRLPEDVASGGQLQQPAGEYIAEATTPSEDAWAREQARFRAKNGEQPSA